jgi:hypothetical protein
MEFTFLEPAFGIISVWIRGEKHFLVSVMEKHVPVYIISFISYLTLLIFFSLGNLYLRKKSSVPKKNFVQER